MSNSSRKALLFNLSWCGVLLVLPVLYALSYSPVYRFTGGKIMGATFYQPVENLIDDSPFRRPLLSWAKVCGVGTETQIDSIGRQMSGIEMTPPPPVRSP